MIDPWNTYIKDEYTRFIDKSKVEVIFEIGSRECGYTQDIINCYTYCKEMHIFECNPLTIEDCKRNIDAVKPNKNLKKLVFNPIAISDKAEKKILYPVKVGDDYGSSSVDFFPTEKSHSFLNKEYIVDCTTINDYCSSADIKKIDLILLDIEGSELNALKGANNILKTVSYIITETQDVERNKNTPLRKDIVKFLDKYGFKEVYTTCNGYFGDSIFVK
jgi:FkbM family methyltransferase